MIRNQIADDYFNGDINPGTLLEELVLSERFEVSRTPVREALHQLITMGIAERTNDRKIRIAQYSPRRLLEMFSVMALLDGEAAFQAARRASSDDVDQLAECQERCRAAAQKQSEEEYYKHNYVFHITIRQIAGNSYLETEASRLQKLLFPYTRTQFQARDRVGDSIKEHDRIVASIKEGNSEEASMRMREHVEVRGDRMLDLMVIWGGE